MSIPTLNRLSRAALPISALLLVACLGVGVAAARAAGPAWGVRAVSEPSSFSPSDEARCEEGNCDRYQLLVANIGDGASVAPLTLTAELPVGITVNSIESGEGPEAGSWTCTNIVQGLSCELPEEIAAGTYTPFLDIRVNPPAESLTGPLEAEFSIQGGGAAIASKRLQTPLIASGTAPFGVTQFGFEPTGADGASSSQAGGHPWQLTSTFSTATSFGALLPGTLGISNISPVENVKNAVVDLPIGMLGNPVSTPKCSAGELEVNNCPPASRIGTFAVIGGAFEFGEFFHTGQFCCSAVFNMVPEHGYPAEFAFHYAGPVVTLYASVVRGADGYQIQAAATGLPSELEVTTAAITFFGDPDGANGGPSGTALLTNPSVCSGDPLSSNLILQSWESPLTAVSADTVAYPGLSGCGALHFEPSFRFGPSDGAEAGSTQADTPSAYTAELEVPQHSGFEELATPPLRDATVTLPSGVSVSPSAAGGLQACAASGPQGINFGSNQIGTEGQDLGDPEATELGAGHKGGNASPYDDGLYHLAPGHCPDSSQLGTVVATTPLLESPLPGHIYLAAPECAPCGDADAQSGKLLRLYLELNDPTTGVVVKLAGSASANPDTGQLTATFKENPQFPFENLKLSFRGGPRAPLANPETCGSFQTNASLEPWSAPETPTANSPSEFQITSGPGGSACANTVAQEPNYPKFQAGTTSNQAGAYSPFVLKLSREDGSQRLKALNVTLPPGLTGKLAGVQECSNAAITAAEGKGGKAEQASPSCPLASELGTVNVGAGPGEMPLYVQGHAYLAGPYKGAPLSLAIITPAVAGPFDLGTVVVRAALFVNEETAQITVKSDPIPQIRAGIPLDVRSIAVNISRNQFTLNPTNCSPMTLAASVIASASEAAVSNPFQVGSCSALGFKPKVAIQLKGGTKRNRHPALKSVITYPTKGSYANIARAAVTLPASEFIDQAHIGNPCIRPDFAAEKCPQLSVLGRAKAWTPLLDKPLEGKVYFRSNGGERELPDLVVALKGQIPVTLVGFVDSVHHKGSEVSRLRTTFATVPDAPVSKFVLELNGGKKGLLVNSENICRKPQKATVKLTAQNGKVSDTTPVISNSCGGKGKKHKGHAHRAAR